MMKKYFFSLIVIIILSQFFLLTSHAVEPDEVLENSKLELRARNISKNVRCLVCQNQSIDDSSADLAKDLRILIRSKVNNGESDQEIYQFLIDRYGDFVLLKPLLKFNTLILWFMPFIFLIIGIFIIYQHHKKSN